MGSRGADCKAAPELRHIRGAEDRPHTRRRDVGGEPATEQALAVRRAAFDIGGGLRVAAVADRMLAVIDDVHQRAAALGERSDDAAHQAVAAAADAAFRSWR